MSSKSINGGQISNAVSVIPAKAPVSFSLNDEQMTILREQIAPDLNESELRYFLEVAKARGLNPILNQIYAIKRSSWDPRRKSYVEKMTIQTAIEGFLLIAERTGEYRGSKTWTTGSIKEQNLIGHATVWKENREPTEVQLDFDEFKQTNKDGELIAMWRRMPKWMIQKVALARALDRAFPEQLGGLYTGDEMPAHEPMPVSPARSTPSRQPARVVPIAPPEDVPFDAEPPADYGAFVFDALAPDGTQVSKRYHGKALRDIHRADPSVLPRLLDSPRYRGAMPERYQRAIRLYQLQLERTQPSPAQMPEPDDDLGNGPDSDMQFELEE